LRSHSSRLQEVHPGSEPGSLVVRGAGILLLPAARDRGVGGAHSAVGSDALVLRRLQLRRLQLRLRLLQLLLPLRWRLRLRLPLRLPATARRTRRVPLASLALCRLVWVDSCSAHLRGRLTAVSAPWIMSTDSMNECSLYTAQ
jgi:hypothetical protein